MGRDREETAMQPLSTYASLLTQINYMNNNTALSTKLAAELSSGKASIDLAGNPNRTQVLDLSNEQNSLNTYITSCTIGTTTTNLYSDSLTNITSIAQTAYQSVENLLEKYTGQPSPTGSTNQTYINTLKAFTQMGAMIDQSMTETQVALNEQSGSGAYLYAGNRYPTQNASANYTLPPCADLTQLPYFQGATSPAPNPAGTTIAGYTPPTNAVDPAVTAAGGANADLPTYDADFSTTRPGAANAANQGAIVGLAWGNHNVTIDDNQTVQVNINSTNPAFQDLVNGLRAAKTAADQAGNYSTADRDKFLTLAYSNLSAAITGLGNLENQNSLSNLALNNKSTVLNTRLNNVKTNLDSFVGVDTTTVTVQLATVNNQLQASYKATSDLLSMSLINYLK
jgi:hypothetical protein